MKPEKQEITGLIDASKNRHITLDTTAIENVTGNENTTIPTPAIITASNLPKNKECPAPIIQGARMQIKIK